MASEPNRSGLTAPALIVALLAALGIGPSLMGSRSPNQGIKPPVEAQASVKASNVSKDVPEHSAAELLANFLDTNQPQIHGDKPWSNKDEPAPWRSEDIRYDYDVRFLIATLPQPDNPALSARFDSDLDAISLALGRDGYLLASYDLPWLDEAAKASYQLQVPGDDDESALAAIKPQGQRKRAEHDPGVILFHREKGDPGGESLMVLFLVGESPTRGVNKTQFRDALDQIAWLSGWRTGNPGPPESLAALGRARVVAANGHRLIKIVGPTFSGSAPSLRNVLEEWSYVTLVHPKLRYPDSPLPRAEIISGGVTALNRELHIDREDPRTIQVEFHTVRIPDSVIIEKVKSRFRRSDNDPPIVMLEDETSYGSKFVRDSLNLWPGLVFKPDDPAFLRIKFPLHISDLRTVYDKAQPLPVPGLSQGLSHNIPIPEEENGKNEDVVRSFSQRSAVYDDLVLQNLLETIRRKGARYVGVVATDTEDLMFLVHQIREHCRDVIIFTTDADLLVAHAADSLDMTGVLVFSTYPLFNEIQLWTNQGEGQARLLQFSTEEAEGAYNATLAQLGDQEREWMVDYGVPSLGSASESSRDNYLSRPLALWLSVVGRGSLWPVRFYPLDPSSWPLLVLPAPNNPRPQLFYPLIFVIGFTLTTIVCILPCILIFLSQLLPRPQRLQFTRSWADLLSARSIFGDLAGERRRQLLAFVGALITIEIVALAYFLLPLRAERTTCSALPPMLVLVGSTALFFAVWRVLSLPVVQRPPAWFTFTRLGFSVEPSSGRVSLGGMAVGFALAVGLFLDAWFQKPIDAALLFVRTTNFANGVSPLMPLIFLGVANLSLFGSRLWRLNELESHRVELPFLGFDLEPDGDSFLGVTRLEKAVVELSESPIYKLPGFISLLVLLSVGFIWFCLRSGASMDHPLDRSPSFEFLFFVSAFFMYFYFSAQMLRLVLLWQALNQLLQRLLIHPRSDAYSALKEDGETKIELSERNSGLATVEYCLDRARQVASRLSIALPVTVAIKVAIKSVENEITEAYKAQKDARWDDFVRRRICADRQLAKLSAQLIALAQPQWRSTEGLTTGEQQIVEQTDLFVAARVLDFIRKVYPQMINLAGTAMTAALAMVLATSSYPFAQHDSLIAVSWVALLGMVAVSMTIFIRMNRNRIISMLVGTKPGRFTWDSTFTWQLLFYAVLPILTMLGAQYPHVIRNLISGTSSIFGGGK